MPKKSLTTEQLKCWKEKIQVSERKFKAEIDGNLTRWRNYYRGKQWPTEATNNDVAYATYKDKVVDNIIFSNIKTIMPSINFRNPKIYVTAKKKPFVQNGAMFDTIAASAILEILLNYYYKELELKRQIDKCIMDALIGPWGILYIGYTAETEKVSGDTPLEINELIKSDSVFAIRISPKDFRVDPEAKDSHLEDARWIAIKWVKKLDEVKSNPKYDNTKDLKTNFKVKVDFGGTSTSDKDSETRGSSEWDRVEGWDIYDRESKRIITLVDNHDKELRNEPWPISYGDGFPVEILFFNYNPDELTPVSDIDIYINTQDEINRIRSMQLDHIRRISQRKYLTRHSSLTLEEKRKLSHGGDGTIVDVDGDPNTVVAPLKDAAISQDIYIVAKSLKDSAMEGSGVTQLEKGLAMKFDTATEPALLQQNTNTRRDERVQNLESFIVHVMKKMTMVLQQTLREASVPMTNEQFKLAQDFSPNKIEKIAGGEGKTILLPWLNATKDDIQGDYNFDIEVGSTRPVNQELRKRDIMTIYQATAQNPYVDGTEVTKLLLEAFDLKDTEKLLKDPQVVAQEQSQQAQSQIQAQQAVDEPKRQADMAKTKMKVDSSFLTTLLKGKMDMAREMHKSEHDLTKELLKPEPKPTEKGKK